MSGGNEEKKPKKSAPIGKKPIPPPLLPQPVREFLKRVGRKPLPLGGFVTLWWDISSVSGVAGGVSVDEITCAPDQAALVAWLNEPSNAAWIVRVDVE